MRETRDSSNIPNLRHYHIIQLSHYLIKKQSAPLLTERFCEILFRYFGRFY